MFMGISSFQKKILSHYKKHGRHNLPWRKTKNPYKILVSEIMLQQTQVDRVIPKYKEFIKKFPTAQTLSKASLQEVLSLWSGLGYNRRAKYLREAAKEISSKGFPKTIEGLKSLSGVGPYTACAVAVFSYSQVHVLIETNIRSVFIHEFFPKKKKVADKDIFPLIEATLYKKDPRMWYWALMDYGAYLKKTLPNPSRKSKHHSTQSAFKGSLREVRGYILKKAPLKVSDIPFEKERVSKALNSLVKEGFLTVKKGYATIPKDL